MFITILPFVESIREFQFPSLDPYNGHANPKVIPNDDQFNAMREYIESLDLMTAARESDVNRAASAHSRLFHCCAARESPTKYRERPPSAASNSLELQYVLQLAAPTTGGRMLCVPQPNSPCTQRSLELINGQSRATLPHGRCG